jgi:hypothetical protein
MVWDCRREESRLLHLNPRSGRWLPDHTHLQHHIGIAITCACGPRTVHLGPGETVRFSLEHPPRGGKPTATAN